MKTRLGFDALNPRDGNKRNFKNFGYILNCDKETEDVQKKAKAMNAVVLCPSFSDEEKERRTAEAESICKQLGLREN